MNKVFTSSFKFFGKFFKTLSSNWIFVVLSMLIPGLLIYIGQGVELIKILKGNNQNLNIFLVLLAFALMYFSIWVVNPFSFYVIRFIEYLFPKKNTNENGETEYKESIVFEKVNKKLNSNSEKIPIRHFANLPIISFHFLLVFLEKNYLQKSLLLFYTTFVLWLVIYYTILYLSTDWYSKNRDKGLLSILNKRINTLFGFLILLFITVTIALIWQQSSALTIISHFLIFVLIILNNVLYYREEQSLDLVQAKRIFIGVALVIIVIMIFLRWMSSNSNLHYISPIFVAVICLTFYIIILDGLIISPSEYVKEIYTSSSKRNLIFETTKVISISFILLASLFSWGSDHTIRSENKLGSNKKERFSLETYYNSWKKVQIKDKADTIILIAGQGGGSRAGAWLYANLDKLKSNKIFAISTVSGSSSGANNFILKEYIKQRLQIKTDSNFCKNLYTYNYLSQSFWGLLFNDGYLGKLISKDKYDRNYYHQQDEMNAFCKALNLNNTDLEKSVVDIFQEDFIEKWSNNNYALPLQFINSATTQAGKRVIFSPISDDDIFTTAIDGYKYFNANNYDKSLLSHTCVNASQSFPFSSAYTYLEGVGNLIDGGLYENTGTNTILELYRKLKTIEKNKNVVFKIICVQSDNSDNDNTVEQKSLFLNTLSSIQSSPFSGHSHYWVNHLKKEVDEYSGRKDTVEMVYLKDKLNSTTKIPLGICLSENTLDSILIAVKK